MRAILSIVGLIIAGGVFFAYTEPAYSNVQEIQKQIDQYNQALDKAAELQKLKATLLSRNNAFNPADIDRLHKLLPDHVDNVRLILDLDRIAGTFGMALQNVVISNPASESADKTVIGSIGAGKQKYDSLTLKFTTRGTYANFVRFMESLELSLRIVDLVSLSISPDGTGRAIKPQGAGTAVETMESFYRYDITIRTYWLR